jgi:hypothetical protein
LKGKERILASRIKLNYNRRIAMSESIEFTRNYSDLSTEQGFQFEFFCDRCGNGFRSRFKPSMVGTLSGAMEAASCLYVGIFGRAADVTQHVKSASWEKAHDDAFWMLPGNSSQTSCNAAAARGMSEKLLEYEERPVQGVRPRPGS